MDVRLRARLVFFDLDGTLVDSAGAIAESWRIWSAEEGVSAPDLERALGGTNRSTMHQLLPPERIAVSLQRLLVHERQTAGQVTSVQGAESLLHGLPRDRWAIVTSSTRDVALARLAAAKLITPDLLVSADDYYATKPSPEPYLVALQKLGLRAEDCLAFEDSPAGIGSAAAAGVPVVGVTTYVPASELRSAWHIADFTAVNIRLHKDGDLDVLLRGA